MVTLHQDIQIRFPAEPSDATLQLELADLRYLTCELSGAYRLFIRRYSKILNSPQSETNTIDQKNSPAQPAIPTVAVPPAQAAPKQTPSAQVLSSPSTSQNGSTQARKISSPANGSKRSNKAAKPRIDKDGFIYPKKTTKIKHARLEHSYARLATPSTLHNSEGEVSDMEQESPEISHSSQSPEKSQSLETPEISESTASAPVTVRKEKSPPPIFLAPNPTWRNTLDVLRLMVPDLKCKMLKNKLKLTFNNVDDYRTINSYLIQTEVPSCTYQLDEDKPFRVVLRGLPYCTKRNDIEEDLVRRGYNVLNITQMELGPKSNRRLTPMFYVQVAKTRDVEFIYNETNILGLEGTYFEKFRGTRGPTQCHRCQGFFHSAIACRLAPRCVRCAKGHLSDDCPHKGTKITCTCANCGGTHPASYKSCPKWPKTSIRRQTRTFSSNSATPGRSYATAAGARDVPRPAPTPNVRFAPEQQQPNPPAANFSVDAVPPSHFDAAAFMAHIFNLETKYSRSTVLKAFELALPDLRSAPTGVDQVFLIYRAINDVVSQGDSP
jgi:hypothetical protein